MDDEKSINDWISKFILPPGLPPTGTPLDASPRPTPEHMGKAAFEYLKGNVMGRPPVGKLIDPSHQRVSGKVEERLYAEPKYEWQMGEVDPPGGKIFKAAKPWKKGIKPAFGKLGKYKDETLHMVGSRDDVHIGLADEIAFDMGAVKTEIVEGHRTPHTAYFKTRKEAQAYKDTIGTSADFIEAETRSLPDTPFAPMDPKVLKPYEGGIAEKPSKFRQLAKGQKPVKVGQQSINQIEKKWEKAGVKIGLYEKDKEIDILTLIVPKGQRKGGTGTKIMSDITEYADKNNSRIVLSPGLKDDYQGTTSRSRLVKFYKRFGFVENKGRNKDFTISKSMYREPKKK